MGEFQLVTSSCVSLFESPKNEKIKNGKKGHSLGLQTTGDSPMEFFQGLKPWKILPPTQVIPWKEFFLLFENEGKISTARFPQSHQ